MEQFQAFGPYALIVFGWFAVRWSSKKMEENKTDLNKRVYAGTWISVLALSIVITALYIFQHVARNPIISGVIRHVPSEYSVVNDPGEDDYQTFVNRKSNDEVADLITYSWTVHSQKRLTPGRKLRFSVYKTVEVSDKLNGSSQVKRSVRELTLPVQEAFYEREVSITYHRTGDKFSLEGDKEETDLKSEQLSTVIDNPKRRRANPGMGQVVYAQSSIDLSGIKARLESSDPVIRRNARVTLGTSGSSGLTAIDEILSDKNSDYRLKLGAIVALNSTSDTSVSQSLSARSLVTILRGIGAPDDTLRNESRKFLQMHSDWTTEAKLSSAIGGSEFPPETASATDAALANMDLLYNIGVIEKDKYRTPKDTQHFDAAVRAFDKAWNLRNAAQKSAQIYFAKALYGWALMLADKAAVDVDQNGNHKPAAVKAAQDKFSQFVDATVTTTGMPSYPATEQIDQAKKYLAKAPSAKQ